MAFPPSSICLRPETFRLLAVTSVHRSVSPYSFKQNTYDFMGGMWRASLDLYSMGARERNTFLRWLVSLEGPKTPFRLRSLDYSGPYGTVTVNPTIGAVASARAQTVTVTLATGDILAVDDQITIAGHLHIVTSAAAKSGDDQVVTIWPRLRASVAVDDPVEALAPYGTWVLAGPENGIALSRRFVQTVTLELIEAI